MKRFCCLISSALLCVAFATSGQTQTTVPAEIVGSWTTTITPPNNPNGPKVIETYKFYASGIYQHSSSLTQPLLSPPGCLTKGTTAEGGRVTVKSASQFAIASLPGVQVFEDTCHPELNSTKSTPAYRALISWRRNGDKLCLISSRVIPVGTEFCYSRK